MYSNSANLLYFRREVKKQIVNDLYRQKNREKKQRTVSRALQVFFMRRSAAELAVVVAGIGGPHLKHIDGVVEVGQPALAREVEVALLALLEEDVPVLLLDGHLVADSGQILLDGLARGVISGVGMGYVLKPNGILGGGLAVVAELVAGCR